MGTLPDARKTPSGPFKALEARVCQQAAVARIGLRALSGTPTAELTEEVLAQVCACLRVPMAVALEHREGTLRPLAQRGVNLPDGMEGGCARGTPGKVLLGNRTPVVIEDIATDRRFARSPVLDAAGGRSCVAVLVHWGEQTVATLNAIDTEPRRFSEEDVAFLQSLANVLATAFQREAQQQMVTSNERFYRALLGHASDLVAIADPDGVLRYVTPSVRNVLGWDAGELVGKPAFHLAHPEDAATAAATWSAAVEAPGTAAFCTIRFRCKDGGYRWVEAIPRNLLGDEVVRGILLNYRDVTERHDAQEALRESEEKLRQSQKIEAVGRLAGGIAHDFNNLLTAILTTVQLSAGELPTEHPLRADLMDIRGAAEKAANLTRQLLAFSRRQVLRPRVLDLGAVVGEMKKMLERLIGEHIRLASHTDAGCTVCADPGQIEQVILNLALNARDAMPRGGTLTLHTTIVELRERDGLQMFGCSIQPGRFVRLQVNDTGAGMDAHTLQRIFEPFFTTKEMGKGTGLGLATVYGVVKQSGGYIRVHSVVGKGSTFEVYFPLSDGMVSTTPQPASAEVRGGRGERVLLVEDEDTVRIALRKALSRAGFEVVEARNGREALQRWREASRIDLLVSDLVMPEMGGRELVTHLRDDSPGLKVLFTSGYTDDTGIRQGDLAKGTAFLSKPFTPEALVRKARELLDQAS